jgi:carboxyl-terminal processing protease
MDTMLRLNTSLRVLLLLIHTAVAGHATTGAVEVLQPQPLQPEPHYARIAQRVCRSLPIKHLSREPLGDSISQRTWTNYLSLLDFEHVYFRQDDIDRFREHATSLDDDLLAGELDFAYEVFDVFMTRLRDRVGYVESLLETGFDLEREETYTLRKRDAPWVQDEAEWNDLWRRKIKNEYVRHVIANEQADLAASNETHTAAVTVPAAETNGLDLVDVVTNLVGDATNLLADAGTTNAPADAEDEYIPPRLTPEEAVLKRYDQMRIVLQDSDADWVLHKYLSAFAHAFDPHSGYMTPLVAEDFDIEMSLSLVGIGALLRSEDGTAKIVRLIPGGPAQRDTSESRLRAGDKIIAVGQDKQEPVDIRHRPLNKVVRLIRGKKGTRVVMLVVPNSDPSGATTKTVSLIRDEVKLDQQAATSETRTMTGSDDVERTLGIIKLPTFYANLQVRSENAPGFRSASYDVAQAVKELQVEGIDGLILDLRSNGGGSLLEAIKMTGLFIRKGPTVMVRERRMVRVLPDTDEAVAYDGPLVVLVNRLSASASEIVAGALQDYGRAIIIGDSKTHGKGTVQTVMPLGLDRRLGKLKVTTASYYRISGESTQLIGVSPDIRISSAYDFMEVGEDKLPNALSCVPVPAAAYEPVSDLAATIVTLRKQSTQRLAQDERYAAYLQLLGRIEELNTKREISLVLDDRRTMAAADKELNDLQEELAPAEGALEEGEDKPRVDIVLDEALRILADYSTAEVARLTPSVEAATSTAKKRWPDLIEDMLKNL